MSLRLLAIAISITTFWTWVFLLCVTVFGRSFLEMGMHSASTLKEAVEWLGQGIPALVIGACLGILTTLAFNRYTEFERNTRSLAYEFAHLSKIVEEIDWRTCPNPQHVWIAFDRLLRHRTSFYYFCIALQKQPEAKLRFDALMRQALDGAFGVVQAVAQMPDNDPELVQFCGRKNELAHIKLGFFCHEASLRHANQVLGWRPKWSMIICGFRFSKFQAAPS